MGVISITITAIIFLGALAMFGLGIAYLVKMGKASDKAQKTLDTATFHKNNKLEEKYMQIGAATLAAGAFIIIIYIALYIVGKTASNSS